MTLAEQRAYLKSNGWKRDDQYVFGLLQERWIRPWINKRGKEPFPFSLKAAMQCQRLKEANK